MVITSLLFSVRSLLVYWNLVNLVTNEQQKSGRTCIHRVATFNVFVKYVYNWLSFSLSQNNVEIKTRWGCHSTDMGLFRCLQMLLRFIDTYVDTLLLQCMGICFDSHLICPLLLSSHAHYGASHGCSNCPWSLQCPHKHGWYDNEDKIFVWLHVHVLCHTGLPLIHFNCHNCLPSTPQ